MSSLQPPPCTELKKENAARVCTILLCCSVLCTYVQKTMPATYTAAVANKLFVLFVFQVASRDVTEAAVGRLSRYVQLYVVRSPRG